jgi:acyl-CoA synthetase (AMP-forming)/AMP-acid ligase II
MKNNRMRVSATGRVSAAVRADYYAAGWWGGKLRDGVESFAASAPDMVAIIDEKSTLTYRDLDDAVSGAVGHLTAAGIASGSTVLVVAPLSAPAVVAYLAAVRCGAIAVMVDRRCGQRDLAYAVASTQPDLVIAPAEVGGRLDLPALGIDPLDLDRLGSLSEPKRDWVEPDRDVPAAVVFTSGTTTTPKCVIHSLNTVRAGAHNMALSVAMTSNDRAFLSTPLASITGLVQTHFVLDNGASLVLEDHFAPAESLDHVIANGVTVFGGAPVVIEELFKEATRRDLSRLPIRVISVGGAMIPLETLLMAKERYAIEPIRVYGSSEAPVSTLTWPTEPIESRLGDDGAPAPGCEVSLDAAGQIRLKGPQLFLGYLDEGHDREAWSADGWFQTGDRGALAAGRLTVVGRLKETVSRKGMKLSLAEIDDVVRELPGVVEAASFALPDEETGERLVVAVVPAGDEVITYAAVSSWLLEIGLAKWKLPEQIVSWGAPLPRTGSGKVQRHELVKECHQHPSVYAPRLSLGGRTAHPRA